MIATGGTSDIPVAEEAALTAEFLGNHVIRLYDVGVAGLHRTLSHLDELMGASVVVVDVGVREPVGDAPTLRRRRVREGTDDLSVGPAMSRDDAVAAVLVGASTADELIDAGGTSVVVSQGISIPEMTAWLSLNGRLPLDEVEAKKASVWVLSFNGGQLTGADYLVSPLPAK